MGNGLAAELKQGVVWRCPVHKRGR